MKNDEQLQQQDLPILLSLKIKFKGITTATACHPSAIRTRDYEDYQDDNALPEGESSAKRQKTSEYGTYLVGKSSSGQAMDQDRNPLGTSTFDAWMEDAGTDDDEEREVDFTSSKKKVQVVFSCQRDPKAQPLTLMNQDLFYLKHGNLRPKKYTLSLHKFPAVSFPDDDMEEPTSRWVDKSFKKFNVYARYSVEHWRNK
nr:hypothetical protein [Tanacetum cinerariifolium]